MCARLLSLRHSDSGRSCRSRNAEAHAFWIGLGGSNKLGERLVRQTRIDDEHQRRPVGNHSDRCKIPDGIIRHRKVVQVCTSASALTRNVYPSGSARTTMVAPAMPEALFCCTVAQVEREGEIDLCGSNAVLQQNVLAKSMH